MNKSIIDECKTVTIGDKSVVYYKSVFLALTEYKEQPKEVEGLEINFESVDEEGVEVGAIDVVMRTPILEMGDNYDLHYAWSLSAEEFKRFEKVSYEPQDRGFYPTQSKIDNGYFLDVTEDFSFGRNLRCYLEPNLMASIIEKMITGKIELPDNIKFISELKQKLLEALKLLENTSTTIEREGYVIIQYNSHTIRVSIFEDDFGYLIALEGEYLPFEAKFTLKLIKDLSSDDMYITMNDQVFAMVAPSKHLSKLICSYRSLSVKYGTLSQFMSASLLDIVNDTLNVDRGKYYSQDMTELINTSRMNRGYELPEDIEILKTEKVDSRTIHGIQFIDFNEYCSDLKDSKVLM